MLVHQISKTKWIIVNRMLTMDTNTITGDPNIKRTKDYPEKAWTGTSWELRNNRSNIAFRNAMEFDTKVSAEQYIQNNQSKFASER